MKYSTPDASATPVGALSPQGIARTGKTVPPAACARRAPFESLPAQRFVNQALALAVVQHLAHQGTGSDDAGDRPVVLRNSLQDSGFHYRR